MISPTIPTSSSSSVASPSTWESVAALRTDCGSRAGGQQGHVPNVLGFPSALPALLSSMSSTTSEYVTDDNCPQNQAVAAQLGDREDTVSTGNVPNLTAEVIDEPPDLSK